MVGIRQGFTECLLHGISKYKVVDFSLNLLLKFISPVCLFFFGVITVVGFFYLI